MRQFRAAYGFALVGYSFAKALTFISPIVLVIVACNGVESEESFECAGKKTCKEMTSCSEARFYLNSCGLKSIDGDSDGTPCEVEWCR